MGRARIGQALDFGSGGITGAVSFGLQTGQPGCKTGLSFARFGQLGADIRQFGGQRLLGCGMVALAQLGIHQPGLHDRNLTVALIIGGIQLGQGAAALLQILTALLHIALGLLDALPKIIGAQGLFAR